LKLGSPEPEKTIIGFL